MATFFVASGTRYQVELQPLSEMHAAAAAAPAPARARGALRREVGLARPLDIARAVNNSPVLRTRVNDPSHFLVVHARPPGAAGAHVAPPSAAITLATDTVIAEGLRQADSAAARNFGAEIINEGYEGKVLLRVESAVRAFALVELLLAREVGAVAPNFLRRAKRLKTSQANKGWAHGRIDVPAAWKVTRGDVGIRVAVLDEGVDTKHPALHPAVVAERDFIGGNGTSAAPDGNDAHGTACAGIVLSRDGTYAGTAPGCSLIAARIAMGDGNDGWIFDDFSTADAIDWCWREGADVLSNSWGGGAPSDAISRAFGRARTQGRNAKGAIVVIAAGNDQGRIDFPGNLPGYLTIGASNPADERKTKTSSDGESWWGSNYGPSLSVVAPGVFIWTTDIAGSRGYEPSDFTKTFNGTSAATPHVAGTAALMLSANPALSAPEVRKLISATSVHIQGQTGWTAELGFGRLDVARAVAAAKSAAPAKTAAKPTTKARKRPAAEAHH